LHKLLLTDILLVILTIIGTSYLWLNSTTPKTLLLVILISYIISKIVGYWILPYDKFELFINNLKINSKLKKFSGFELFKTSLVILLFIGFIFFNPIFWFFESILVIMMRIWGFTFIKNLEKKH